MEHLNTIELSSIISDLKFVNNQMSFPNHDSEVYLKWRKDLFQELKNFIDSRKLEHYLSQFDLS